MSQGFRIQIFWNHHWPDTRMRVDSLSVQIGLDLTLCSLLTVITIQLFAWAPNRFWPRRTTGDSRQGQRQVCFTLALFASGRLWRLGNGLRIQSSKWKLKNLRIPNALWIMVARKLHHLWRWTKLSVKKVKSSKWSMRNFRMKPVFSWFRLLNSKMRQQIKQLNSEA